MFEIIYENINDIDHNNDAWAKRDSQMKLEINDTEKHSIVSETLKETKKTKKKTKIIKKIEKEYEIVNDIETKTINTEPLIEETNVPIKKTRKSKNKT